MSPLLSTYPEIDALANELAAQLGQVSIGNLEPDFERDAVVIGRALLLLRGLYQGDRRAELSNVLMT